MPNERYPVTDSNGNEVVSTANGSFFTASMATSQSNNCQVYVEFYSDAAGTVPVTPSAGTVSVYGTPLGNNYLVAGSNPTITASTVAYPNSTYTPPTFTGRMIFGKVTFAGVTGAAYARVVYWRF